MNKMMTKLMAEAIRDIDDSKNEDLMFIAQKYRSNKISEEEHGNLEEKILKKHNSLVSNEQRLKKFARMSIVRRKESLFAMTQSLIRTSN